MADGWARTSRMKKDHASALSVGGLLTLAYPDRIAKARGKPGEFLMANGRGGSVEPHDRLAREPYLAVAEIAGGAASARILAAAPIGVDEIDARGWRRHRATGRDRLRPAGAGAAGPRGPTLWGPVVARAPVASARDRGGSPNPGQGHRVVGTRRACRGPKPCRNGASASCSCATRRVRNGPTSPTRRLPPRRRNGSRRISSGAPG